MSEDPHMLDRATEEPPGEKAAPIGVTSTSNVRGSATYRWGGRNFSPKKRVWVFFVP